MSSAAKFLGASVINFSSTLGWNESSSELTVNLVEDVRNGDRFILDNDNVLDTGVGQPYTFQMGTFVFRGLIKRWVKQKSESGNPTYQVILEDARSLLKMTQLILDGYYGGTAAFVKNLLNVFGFWEADPFSGSIGGSLSNEGGMPWKLIEIAINQMVNVGLGDVFGGPILFRGYGYRIDLSELPQPPFFYRIQGDQSLLDAISTVCQDSGYDFYVTLEDFTIKIKTISRRTQYPVGPGTGKINDYIEANGQVRSSERGWEIRDDAVTAVFLVGSQISQIYPAVVYNPFWGLDINGNAIASRDLEDSTVVNLNSLQVFDIIGSEVYPCKIGELRLAQAGQDVWLAYICIARPDLAQLLQVQNVINLNAIADAFSNHNALAANRTLDSSLRTLQYFSNAVSGLDQYLQQKIDRMHGFLVETANAYMGRQFIVKLPFIAYTRDEETNNLILSHEVDRSAYLEDGQTLGGLSPYNLEFFKEQDGRIVPIAQYINFNNIDLSAGVDDNSIVQQDGVYTKISVDTTLFFVPEPAVVVTLPSCVCQINPDGILYGDLISYIFNVFGVELSRGAPGHINFIKSLLMGARLTGTIPIRIAPKALIPNVLYLPIRNNRLTYGPWFIKNGDGMVRYIKDESLNPWNAGSYEFLQVLAIAKLFSSATDLLISEAGQISFAGFPDRSLGEVLAEGGSNLTKIDVSVGPQGVITDYTLRSFDTKFIGLMSKKQEDRFLRLSRGIKERRNRIREAIQRQLHNKQTVLSRYIESVKPLRGLMNFSPHDMLVARVNSAGTDASSMTFQESLTNVHPNQPDLYLNTGMVSFDGIFHPFTTDPHAINRLPAVTDVDSFLSDPTTGGLCYDNLSPYAQPSNTIQVYLWGDTYSDQAMNSVERSGNTPHNVRTVGLRGPLMIAGRGFNIQGTPTPTGTQLEETQGSGFNVGPLDAIWDYNRGVWTSHDLILCKAPVSGITAGGQAALKILSGPGGNECGKTLDVYNPWSMDIGEGKKILAGYVAYMNKNIVVTYEC